jgi:adenylate cyclase
MGSARVRVTQSIELSSARSAVWPLVTETDRINRWVGLPPVSPQPIEPGSPSAHKGARFVVQTTSAGIPTTYEEYPFEWENEKYFRVLRKMRGGPFESLTVGFELADGQFEGGTRLDVSIEVLPRTSLVRPLAWAAGRSFLGKLARLAKAIDAHVREHAPHPYLHPASKPDAQALSVATNLLARSGVDGALVERISTFVGSAADADVLRIRPFELASQWQKDKMDVLRAFLHAVPAGLVELRWGVICPSCRTASREVTALDQIGENGHCQLCDVSFELDLDRAVEATFTAHPSIRAVPEQMFCIGGPARTPHVLSQTNVPDGDDVELTLPADAGRYRLFARGGANVSIDATGEAPSREVSVELLADGASLRTAALSPGGTLKVKNASGEGRHVKIERMEYASQAATAHAVSTLPEFRRLFSGDLLKRETPLKVARVAILFSDLTGSTALYTRVGDAAAFRLVDDHFDVIREAVAAHGGAVVKTMGDAVMAAFVDAAGCARAAIQALRDFESFRGGREHGAFIGLKLGMFAGPCYVVSANGVLDYFGQTVNVASRVQHLAESGQLLMDLDIYESLGREETSGMRVLERFEARVKGVDAPLRLLRLHLSASMPPRMPPRQS